MSMYVVTDADPADDPPTAEGTAGSASVLLFDEYDSASLHAVALSRECRKKYWVCKLTVCTVISPPFRAQ